MLPIGEFGGWGKRDGWTSKSCNLSGNRGAEMGLTQGAGLLMESPHVQSCFGADIRQKQKGNAIKLIYFYDARQPRFQRVCAIFATGMLLRARVVKTVREHVRVCKGLWRSWQGSTTQTEWYQCLFSRYPLPMREEQK